MTGEKKATYLADYHSQNDPSIHLSLGRDLLNRLEHHRLLTDTITNWCKSVSLHELPHVVEAHPFVHGREVAGGTAVAIICRARVGVAGIA